MTEETYPEWTRIEKDISKMFVSGCPRFKLESVQQAEEKELRSEPIDTPDGGKSIQMFPHVYFYANITYTRKDGAKCVSHVDFPYYKAGSEWVPKFKYGNLGGGDVVSQPTSKDPMELDLTGALELIKKYTEAMVKNHFPSAKWSEYVKSNNAKLTVKNVVLNTQNGESGIDGKFEDINYGNLSRVPILSCLVNAEYSDSAGSFEFSYPTYHIKIYAITGSNESWTLGNSTKQIPLEKLTPDEIERIKELVDPNQEPKEFYQQYVAELPPKEKALKLMNDQDPNQKREGLNVLQFEYSEFINDLDLVKKIVELSKNSDQGLADQATSLLEYVKNNSNKAEVKSLLESSAAAEADSELSTQIKNLKSSDDAAFSSACSFFYKDAEKYATNNEVVTTLTDVCLAGKEVPCNILKKMNKYDSIEFQVMCKDLDSEDTSKRADVISQLSSDQRLADNPAVIEKLISLKLNSKDMREKSYLSEALGFLKRKCAAKLTPELLQKVTDAMMAR